MTSFVYIVGAGPGDPSLLTLKAKEIIEKADVIAYDKLVSKEILELALRINPKVKLLAVGKIGWEKDKSLSQEKINKLLLELSKDYKIICRLKGGDPNIFGRGGEEAAFLSKNNINFEFVPGVSSISAVPAYSGIPLTHRDYTSSFTVISAHEDPDDPKCRIKWENFDAINNTLVLLMGTKNLPKVITKLKSLGRSGDTPVAVIYWGTTYKQKTLVTTLDNTLEDTKKYNIKAPSLIVIGEVVNFRKMLNWFEKKPLFGKRVLITRSIDQSDSFSGKLIREGAKPINCPTVSYVINEKEIYNKNIINNISKYDWIFFTSQNGVKYFFEILSKNYFDSRALSKCQIAAVGHKTKLELAKHSIKADFIPKKFSLTELIKELSELTNIKEKSILHLTQTNSSFASPLPNITPWFIYKAVFIESIPEETINQIKEGTDVMTFFSSNTARHFMKLLETHNLMSCVQGSLTAAIGEETSKTVKGLFGKTDILADPHTEEGMINSIEKYFVKRELPSHV